MNKCPNCESLGWRVKALEWEIENGEPENRQRLLREAYAHIDALTALLIELRGWDVMDSQGGDGAYWRKRIDDLIRTE